MSILPSPIGIRNEVPNHIISEIERNENCADYQYECLKKEILDFQHQLDNEHEIAVMLASFGQSITLAVTGIRYRNPSLIIFEGFANRQHTTLIQHINQLNFLLTSVPKQDPEQPARRIGFDTSDNY